MCLDIIHISLPRTQRIRNLVNKATGIPVENIMISASHNHSGPDLDAPECEEWASSFETQVVDVYARLGLVERTHLLGGLELAVLPV